MGVLSESSLLIVGNVGVEAECTIGDRSSEGYVAERGVLRADSAGLESVVAMVFVDVPRSGGITSLGADGVSERGLRCAYCHKEVVEFGEGKTGKEKRRGTFSRGSVEFIA
jgi:hypothetical protein